jgi:metal-sulfur cluster biosynthetic enzyme
MVSEEEIRRALDSISVPALERSLGSLSMVRSVQFSDQGVNLELAALAISGLARSR